MSGRPVYTHGGQGLANKAHKNEYVSIRDVDSIQKPVAAETAHDIVWAERYPAFKSTNTSGWFMMSDTTSVHLTAPYSHPMGLKCTISGRLRPNSITHLQELFRETTTSALSAEVSVKPIPDADGFVTVRPSPSRAGSTYSRQGTSASIMRSRDSYRPSPLSSYQPQR
jgi:hypothetical protein